MRFSNVLLAAGALVSAALVVGCGGNTSPQPAPTVAASASSVAAYFVYPTATPASYAANAFRQGATATVVVAVSNLNSSYRLALSATSPFASPFPAPSPLALQAGPPSTLLPNGFGPLPSPSPGFVYAFANAQLVAAATYTATLVGCATLDATGQCASPSPLATGVVQTDCGSPPPVPVLPAFLVAPVNGSQSVPVNVGTVLVGGAGASSQFFGPPLLSLVPSTGATIAAGPLGSPPPGPLPSVSPNALPIVAGSIPALASGTTYTVVFSTPDFSGASPTCTTPRVMTLGTFTTGPPSTTVIFQP